MDKTDQNVLRWEYPVFIIGTADCGSVVAVDYEEFTCCMVYRTLELAELYIEQVAKAGGATYKPIPVHTAAEFVEGLTPLKSQGITHLIWNSVLTPTVFRVDSVEEVLRIARQQAESEGGASPGGTG